MSVIMCDVAPVSIISPFFVTPPAGQLNILYANVCSSTLVACFALSNQIESNQIYFMIPMGKFVLGQDATARCYIVQQQRKNSTEGLIMLDPECRLKVC